MDPKYWGFLMFWYLDLVSSKSAYGCRFALGTSTICGGWIQIECYLTDSIFKKIATFSY